MSPAADFAVVNEDFLLPASAAVFVGQRRGRQRRLDRRGSLGDHRRGFFQPHPFLDR